MAETADPIPGSVPNAGSDITQEDEEDKLLAEYDVYLTPEQEEQLYLLQYVNRPGDQPFNRSYNSKPSAMRIKNQAGFVEVDIPINIHVGYNKIAGVRWGEALRKSKANGQKAWGFAGGFDHAKPPRPPPRGPNAPPPPLPPTELEEMAMMEDYVRNIDDAAEKGHVLTTQTLGGQIPTETHTNANYMIATFRDNDMYLTKLAHVVQMTPQHSHIDAIPSTKDKGKEGAEPKAAEAKAVMVQQKKGIENPDVERAKKFLRNAFEEKWIKMRYFDDEDDEAYETYNDTLFLENPNDAPNLKSSMTNDEYLEAVSAPSIDRLIGKKKVIHKPILELSDTSDDEDDGEIDEDVVVPSVEQADLTGDAMDVDENILRFN